MIINHMFKDDILYLEIDTNYDFGDFEFKHKKLADEIKEYIDKAKLIIKKNKIILTCGGVIIGSILLTNFTNSDIKDNMQYVPSFNNSITYLIKDNDTLENSKTEITEETKDVSTEQKENIETKQNTYSNATVKGNIPKNNYNQNTQANTQTNTQKSSEIATENKQSGPTVTVHRNNGSVITIGLEEYIIGVVAAEMPASFNIEALKAQSVIARTYALKAQSTGKILTDTVSTQAYIDTNQMRTNWGSGFNTYYNKVKNAVESTSGEYLTYNGTYIEAMYHSTNNGKTESSLDVFGNYYPYLVSVTSEFDKSASSYLRTVSMDINTISSKLGINLSSDSIIEILSYTDGSNIKEINIGGSIFTGRQVREALGLRSADFDIVINGNNASITTRGYGHGVGMSQYGSNGMANAGYNYKSILSHYYPGTTIKK